MRAAGVIFAVLVFLAASCGETSGSGQPPGSAPPSSKCSAPPSSKLSTVAIEASGGKKVEVGAEIADGLYEQSRGLMGRRNLAENRGMLFVFGGEQTLSFTMKNTRIPLSIAFLDSEGRIVDIQDMKPFDDEEPHYVSAEPAQYALEVNQGFFEECGVKVGDRAKLPE